MSGSPLNLLDPRVFDAAMDELREKSKKRIYQTDFTAWQADILGERTYEKMQQIGHDALLDDKPRTMVKSANGSAKTFQAARWGMWWATAFDPNESLVIFTAPTLSQVEKGVIAYAKSCYGHVKRTAMAAGKPMPWPGWITEQNEWKYAADGGNQVLAFGRVPGAQDAVSTFQGARKPGGRNFIILDEAGGVSADIYTAIEALMTGGDSRMVGIGNPDRRGTDFYRIFTDQRLSAEYNLHTISAYDLPTMTGEVVYPNDPEKEALMLKGLTSAKWIAHKERVWKTGGEIVYDPDLGLDRNLTGTPDARFKAKVLGEFPDADDRAFFPESDITAAAERELEPGGAVVLGVDLAAMGGDESVVMVNRGGHVRVFDKTITYDDGGAKRETTGTWSKEDEVTSARRVHAIATYLGADEVRLDASGLGGGIAAMLTRLDEFDDKKYLLIQINGANSSTDRDRWANARAMHHDQVRELLRDGAVDIDPSDTALRDQLLSLTYDLTPRGAVQLTKKRDLRSEMHGSPDRSDALVYALLDTSPLTSNPLGHLAKGDVVRQSPWDLLMTERGGAGWPL